MTQEDKELLLKDLCSRLPYEVKGIEANTLCLLNTVTHFKSIVKNIEYKIEHLGFKPYLFPMSSMTDEQEEEYNKLNCYEGRFPRTEEALDYVIANHFDYRDLISMGLAKDATGLNIY